jgi:hypothetical protein
MLVSRKYFDAGAAFSCAGGTVLIASGIKPVPTVISFLGTFAFLWGVLMVVGCFGAGVGAILRNRASRPGAKGWRRRLWSITLERLCWPAIAWSAALFCLGVVLRFGWIDAALTLGWSGFVILTCVGHWWVIRRASKGVT